MQIVNIVFDDLKDGFCVSLEDGSQFVISYQTYDRMALHKGMVLTPQMVSDLNGESEAKKALFAAQNFLAYRPRSQKEVEDNLRKKGFADPVIHKALGILAQRGLIDEEAFASGYSQEKSRLKRFSKKRIRYELKSKGLDDQVIDSALEALSEEDEYANALALGRKHLASRDIKEVKHRQKTYRYLVGKGFSYEIVSRVISAMEDGD